MIKTTRYVNAEGFLAIRNKLNARIPGWANIPHGGAPQALTKDVWETLANDGVGAFADTLLPEGFTGLWTGSELDFSEIPLGSLVRLRVDMVVTTGSNNQSIDVQLSTFSGGSPIFAIPLAPQSTYKNAGAHQIVTELTFFIGPGFRDVGPPVEDFVPKVQIRADGMGTSVALGGWFVVAEVL